MFYYPQLPFKGKLRGSTVNASDNSREWLSCTTNVGVNLFLVVKNYTTYPRVLNIPIFCGSIFFYFISFFFFSFFLSFFSCGKWLWRYGLGRCCWHEYLQKGKRGCFIVTAVCDNNTVGASKPKLSSTKRRIFNEVIHGNH